MSQLVFNDAVILFQGCNLSGDTNRVEFQYGAQMLNDSAFGDTFESNAAGILTAQCGVSGFWNIGTNPDFVDSALFAALGGDDKVLAVFPNSATEGSVTDRGCAMLCTTARYSPFNSAGHGQLLPYAADFRSRGVRLLRATPLKKAIALASPITGSGTGTAYQVGAITGEDLVIPTPLRYLYAGLHVLRAFADSGFSLTVTVQSAPLSTGSWTTRNTFSAATTTGGQYMTPLAGPITDSWWRSTWTLAGVDASTRFLVWMAIDTR